MNLNVRQNQEKTSLQLLQNKLTRIAIFTNEKF